MAKLTIGLDFGTNSARALLVDVSNGQEMGTSVSNYAHGQQGIILDSQDPHLARQHPQDYLDAIVTCVKQVMAESDGKVSPNDVIGIGVDTTGSTPLPVDTQGMPLARTALMAGDHMD